MMGSLKSNGIFLMLLASLFFSIMGALVKAVTGRLPVMEAVFARGFVSLLLIVPWMFLNQIPFWGKNKKLLLLRSLAGFVALGFIFYVTSQIELADASILALTNVIFVAILSVLFLKEKFSFRLIIYVLIAFVGCALIIRPRFDVVNVPGLVGLAGGFLAAVAYVSIKKLHETESYATMVFYFSWMTTLGSLIFFGKDFILPHKWEWLSLIGLGVSGTLGQVFMTYSYKHAPASVINPFSFSQVIFSFSFGLIFWGEIPNILSLIGTLLIMICGIGIMRIKKEVSQ